MGLPVFYATEQNIDTSVGVVTITGADARHLVKSLRVRQGDAVTTGDANGTLYEAVIESSLQDTVTMRIVSRRYLPPERPQVVLFQAMPRFTAMDEAVSRAAESGASRVVPFVSRCSPLEAVRKSGSRLGRWQSIARECSKTSRRAWPLEVRAPVAGLIDKTMLDTVGCCVVFWEAETRALSDVLPDEPPRSIGIVIGPEGGLEPAEVDVMRTLGCKTASLGALNIRSEGAGSYAAILIRYHYGLLARGGSPVE